MTMLPPINFQQWIDDNRHLLKPPVGNKVVYKDTEFIIMVVGGPNSRKDYHIDPAEEFFYMIEGDMLLKIVDDGEFKDVPIKEGEIFLLPPNIPHSPQRFPNTVGLVVERRRNEGELDGLRWYCDDCGEVLYEETFEMEDIVEQLKAVIERFYNSEEARTCDACGAVMPVPTANKAQ